MTKHTEASAEVVAWIRLWAFNKEKPYKIKDDNGRMVWPIKFKFNSITANQCQKDDVALVRQSALLTEQEKVRELEAKVADLEGAKEMLLDRLRELGDAN